jgi:hypothetical protein
MWRSRARNGATFSNCSRRELRETLLRIRWSWFATAESKNDQRPLFPEIRFVDLFFAHWVIRKFIAAGFKRVSDGCDSQFARDLLDQEKEVAMNLCHPHEENRLLPYHFVNAIMS